MNSSQEQSKMQMKPELKQSNKPKKKVLISDADLQNYLSSLPHPQKRQLEDFIQNHPFIYTQYIGSVKYYWSQDRALRQIQFLIAKSKQRMLYDSFIVESFIEEQVQSKMTTTRINNISVTEENYRQIINNICFLKKIDAYPFEALIRERVNKAQDRKPVEIIVTNKCRGFKKIIIIFQKIHELVLLQSLVDFEWRLQTLSAIRANFEQQGKKMVRVPYDGRQIYIFLKTSPKSWPLIIDTINKQSLLSSIIFTKFQLFPQLYSHANKFEFTPRIAFHQPSFALPHFELLKQTRFESELDYGLTEKLCLRILRNNSRQYSYNKVLLDCITSYNIIVWEQKGIDEMLCVLPDQSNTKSYIYFTFYSKLMEVTKQKQRIILIEREINKEITSQIIRGSLQRLIKEAVLYQIPFFYFYQTPGEVSTVSLERLKRQKCQDINRLLFYEHKLLNEKHYKITYSIDKDIDEFIVKHSQVQTVKFQRSELQKKIGSIKSGQIIKKFRDREKACLTSSASYCTSFIRKCIQELRAAKILKDEP